MDNFNSSPRKAFIFYSNWYEDALITLKNAEIGDFLAVVVRYASHGVLPSEDVNPVIRSMFGLIKNVVDADLKKYDAIVERNRRRTEARLQSTPTLRGYSDDSPIHNTQDSTLKTQDSTSSSPSVEVEGVKGKEKPAGGFLGLEDVDGQVAESGRRGDSGDGAAAESASGSEESGAEKGTASRPTRQEVRDYWQSRGWSSSADEFFDHYDANDWVGSDRRRLSSWRRAAAVWEQRYRDVVVPARRREAEAQRREQERQEAIERARYRNEQREAFQREADQRAATAVGPALGRYMYQRALALTSHNQQEAFDLLRRASDEPEVFSMLRQGFG